MIPVCVGDFAANRGTPNRYITVEVAGIPHLRIDVYAGKTRPETFAFEEAIIWGEWVVIGIGDRAYLVSFRDQRASTIELGSYFGHLYPFDQFLLIASGERLFMVQAGGELAWSTDILGIDGVVVDQIVGTTIEGQGEWDPPGGWQPFRVDLRSGTKTA